MTWMIFGVPAWLRNGKNLQKLAFHPVQRLCHQEEDVQSGYCTATQRETEIQPKQFWTYRDSQPIHETGIGYGKLVENGELVDTFQQSWDMCDVFTLLERETIQLLNYFGYGMGIFASASVPLLNPIYNFLVFTYFFWSNAMDITLW